MTETDCNPARRIGLGGIKFSLELVQLNCRDLPGERGRAGRLLRHLADNRINVPFLCLSSADQAGITSCCIEAEDFGRIEGRIQDADLRPHLSWIEPVGTLTLFPHQASLHLLERTLVSFEQAGLPIYGVGTSLSALTVSTDYRLLDRAVMALETWFDLPPRHTPFRPEFRVKQL
jgi:hypothetical protein